MVDTKKTVDVEAERQAAREWAKTILPPVTSKSPATKATPKEKPHPAPKSTPKSIPKKSESPAAAVAAVPAPIKSPIKKTLPKKTPAKSPASKTEPSPKPVSIPKISTPKPAVKFSAQKEAAVTSDKKLFYTSSELFIRLVAFLTCFYFLSQPFT